MQAEDRAYCAGLYEGEGYITFGLRKRNYQDGTPGRSSRTIVLGIGMTDRYPLDLFDDVVGFGIIYGPYDKGSNSKPMYTYKVYGLERVQHVVCNIWYWLSPRRKDQITTAFTKYHAHPSLTPKRISHWRSRIPDDK